MRYLIAAALLAALAACVSPSNQHVTSEVAIADPSSAAELQVEGVVEAIHAGNSCSAPANEGCSGCQISCPSDMIAACRPGEGQQVLGPGGVWQWQCWIQAGCSCTKPAAGAL